MGSSFEDLEVWKRSSRLAVKVYELLKDCRDWGTERPNDSFFDINSVKYRRG